MSHTRPYRIFNAALARFEDITPHLRRLTFTGPEIRDMATWAPDQRIKIFFPTGDGRTPDMPDTEDWYATYKSVPVADRVPMRTYTIRNLRADSSELDVEFVLHGENGPASRWATHAKPGDKVQISAPNRRAAQIGGGYEWKPPADPRHVLLMADETAIPALAGILEELAARPTPPPCEVFAEVADRADALALPTWPGLTINWLIRHEQGDPRPGDLLVNAIDSAKLPAATVEEASVELETIDIDATVPWELAKATEGAFYAWIAGESEAIMSIRRTLIKERGIDRSLLNLMGYWRFGKVYE
ncbi:siderophore-interacting protein [Devosia sp.]|uniref:siderophore-interacting protein n=1 Tax=Devosia sp. TaxID=1871048 RepID=UPI0025B7BAAC|nr:siderophore-interacting protein [Devosia sp.]